jgi:hypothetical protein
MVDLRYLVLTMIGIFLALAVGLMIGSALGSPERQARVFDSLREQFDQLRAQNQSVQEENSEMRRRLAARDEADQALLPGAVRGRLAGLSVGVVLCGNWDEAPFWTELETALQLSGATIGPVVRIPDRLKVLEPAARTRLGTVWGGGTLPDRPEPYEAAGWLVRALARGLDSDRLANLAGEIGAEVRGQNPGPLRRVLVIAAVPDSLRAESVISGETPEVRVVDVAREEGIRVVAAEPEETTQSAVVPLRSRTVASVDNIDTAVGQLAAVLALAGADGHFGTKRGATRVLPPLDRP